MAAEATVRFSHIHSYVDSLKPLEEYQKLATKMNAFAGSLTPPANQQDGYNVKEGRSKWLELESSHGNPATGNTDAETYSSAGQDLVEQQIVGLGWRIAGVHNGDATTSVVLASSAAVGVQFIFTAHKSKKLNELEGEGEDDAMKHFAASNLARFSQAHNTRQGFAILGFEVSAGDVDRIHARYAEVHPKLVVPGSPFSYDDGTKVLEVFAYYQKEKDSDADLGTVIRFVEYASKTSLVLPGFEKVETEFDGVSQPAYCDHWVSNVVSRTGFLDTLNDVLGFTPKVDFNAGVVAAGEAQIESTVTGNSPGLVFTDMEKALVDHNQVYLPINNALSEVGHVNIFLREIGQGIQHVASRVPDLVAHIQKVNDFRKMTGAGFSFLMIPRSYYGYLSVSNLVKDSGLETPVAEKCLAALKEKGIVDHKNIVDLDATADQVKVALPSGVPESVIAIILRGRYRNLHALLREQVTEDSYIRMVRNNILVDVQGEDLLMQIFTAKVLSRSPEHEAPFMEFIQRLCSQKPGCEGLKIKPGCGGFGIRNFLTLFLSIEVSKAAQKRAEASSVGNQKDVDFHDTEVEYFTSQLDQSNPILTGISDAMTEEGLALDRGDADAVAKWASEKAAGNEKLQQLSAKYKDMMAALRAEHTK